MVERVIRTLKDQCVHRHGFETLQHASRVFVTGLAFTTTSGLTRPWVCKPLLRFML